LEEEDDDMFPWISSEEMLSFDWHDANKNAPEIGPRYKQLPRIIERVRETNSIAVQLS